MHLPDLSAKLSAYQLAAKIMCNGFIEVCNRCTLFGLPGKCSVILQRQCIKAWHEKMNKRVRISNDSLNSYGSRVLTSGMSVEQYCRNPVLLYMHQRGNVIGYVKDLRVEDGEVTGELVFDEATDLSKRCKKQFEFGSLRMVSAGIDILELSDQPEHLLQGQTSPTITKSKLYEVSLVDVGSNDDAIVLMKDGKQITLGKDGDCPLPLINNQKTTEEMELKLLALQLGLPETATEADVNQALNELKAAKTENDSLKQENGKLTLARITGLVEKAVVEKRLGEDKKTQFIELGKKVGVDELKNVLDAMQPQVKISTVLSYQGGKQQAQPSTYAKLSDVPSDALLEMREHNPEEYKRLYKAEYGMTCEI